MDKPSKILVTLFVILILALSAFQYRQIVIKHGYSMKAHTSCDETISSCFQTVCSEEDGTDCEPETYAKITKNISTVELCNQYEREDCPDLTCSPGEKGCEVVYCTTDDVEDGETCVGPVPATESAAAATADETDAATSTPSAEGSI